MARTNDGPINPRAGAPKQLAVPGDVHGGMHHISGDVHVLGLSSTEAQRIMQNDGGLNEIHGGGVTNTAPLKEMQKGAPLKPHPSMTSQRQREANMGDGSAILASAIKSGSTALPAQTSEQDCPADPALKP